MSRPDVDCYTEALARLRKIADPENLVSCMSAEMAGALLRRLEELEREQFQARAQLDVADIALNRANDRSDAILARQRRAIAFMEKGHLTRALHALIEEPSR